MHGCSDWVAQNKMQLHTSREHGNSRKLSLQPCRGHVWDCWSTHKKAATEDLAIVFGTELGPQFLETLASSQHWLQNLRCMVVLNTSTRSCWVSMLSRQGSCPPYSCAETTNQTSADTSHIVAGAVLVETPFRFLPLLFRVSGAN